MENIKEPLERILAREWNQSLKPYEYHITPEINRLIDAGWVYKRMSMHGHWILGWTELGWAAATVCGLCEVDTNLILEMGAEIERQREEIAALQEALESVWDMGHETIMKDNVTDLRFGLQAIKNLALRYTTPPPRPTKAAPAPEPAPRKFKVDDRVVANSHAIEGMRGTIVDVAPGVNRIAPYRVHIDNMSYDFQLKESELELAVTEPPIKVGDTVRITSGGGGVEPAYFQAIGLVYQVETDLVGIPNMKPYHVSFTSLSTRRFNAEQLDVLR